MFASPIFKPSRLKRSGLLAIFVSLSAIGAGQAAEMESFRFDPVHTRVMFSVSHAGFSKAIGTVSGGTGTLTFDPKNWNASKLDVAVPMQRVDFGDPDWNAAVLAKKLLDVESFPTVRYVSTRVESIDPQHATIFGMLTLHGVAHEVKLNVVLNALKRHPMPPFRRTVGFSATGRLNRSDFGIAAWQNLIGDEVELRIEVEAVRSPANDNLSNQPAAKTSADLSSPTSKPISPIPITPETP